jgi:hypothetical protein
VCQHLLTRRPPTSTLTTLTHGIQSYSLFSIGYSLFTFGDADEAADELRKEVVEAKKDLAKKGIIVADE